MDEELVTVQKCTQLHNDLEKRIASIEDDIKLAKIALQVIRWSLGVAIATAIIIAVERLLQ